mmetsp:Transcript_16780/g.52484  ORF Transcript_16780/g.52484 Transcript_16780/m.52484 type:complete len:229 (+) Transcript_16780:113-799(+)
MERGRNLCGPQQPGGVRVQGAVAPRREQPERLHREQRLLAPARPGPPLRREAEAVQQTQRQHGRVARRVRKRPHLGWREARTEHAVHEHGAVRRQRREGTAMLRAAYDPHCAGLAMGILKLVARSDGLSCHPLPGRVLRDAPLVHHCPGGTRRCRPGHFTQLHLVKVPSPPSPAAAGSQKVPGRDRQLAAGVLEVQVLGEHVRVCVQEGDHPRGSVVQAHELIPDPNS